MGLEAAADMEEAFGIPSYGKRYRETASSIKRTIKEKYWDAERGLFSDTRDRRNYSQHVNVLAILNENTRLRGEVVRLRAENARLKMAAER